MRRENDGVDGEKLCVVGEDRWEEKDWEMWKTEEDGC